MKARGLFSYLNQTTPRGIKKEERNLLLKGRSKEFYAMSQDDRRHHLAVERDSVQRRHDEISDHQCVDTYARDIGDKLFGLSSETDPLISDLEVVP